MFVQCLNENLLTCHALFNDLITIPVSFSMDKSENCRRTVDDRRLRGGWMSSRTQSRGWTQSWKTALWSRRGSDKTLDFTSRAPKSLVACCCQRSSNYYNTVCVTVQNKHVPSYLCDISADNSQSSGQHPPSPSCAAQGAKTAAFPFKGTSTPFRAQPNSHATFVFSPPTLMFRAA